MNGRERFQRVMHYEPVDRVSNIEAGAWLHYLDVNRRLLQGRDGV